MQAVEVGRMKRQTAGLLLLLLISSALASKANKHKPWIETEYQGIVMENDNTVLLNPPLFALDKDAPLHYAGEVCGFRVHSGGSSVPFEAVVLDKSTGEGLIRAKEPLDCEAQREHSFTIQAYDCGEGPEGTNSKKSHKATVHVRVNDVNEFAPVFLERLYQVSVSEGRLYDRILRVEAIDADCSPQFSQICFYEILTPNMPFTIDNDGNIKNSEVLDFRRQRLYRFSVTAYDCGKKRAVQDSEVQIEVKPTCKPAWTGWSKRIEYTPGSGSVSLLPSMHLETCDEPVWNIQATIELQTNHIGKGCDRDSYSDRSVRRLCGAVRGEVDLLPPPSLSTNWTAGLTTVPSPDSSLVFVFNGSVRQACEVPQSALRELGVSAGDHFTLQLWMKHASGNQPAQQQHGRARKEEESIICNTVRNDDSFSHYSLSVHSCRLSLLYWPQLTSARPVKFLWKLEQVCDDDWHHYAVNLEFPTVTLYVDGVTYDPALIHDNGPLRPPAPRPRLVIGASWTEEAQKGSTNGSESEQDLAPPQFQSHFRGLLAGFTVRPGRVEPHSVIECLYACREGLDFGDLESLGSGMKVHVNPTQSMLILEGDDIENFNRAIQQITYRNSLRFATPGVRPLRISTSLRCFSEEGCVSIRDVEGYLVVLQPDAPQIFLSGMAHFALPASEFETPQGVPLFSELRITCSLSHSINTASQGMEGGALMSDAVAHTLDGCEVSPVGEELDLQREELILDPESVKEKGLELINNTAYIAISGAESISVYEDLLRSLRYRISFGAALYERKFRLSCTEMNGRYASNEFSVEVNFLHSVDAGQSHPNHLLSSQQFMPPLRHNLPPELTGHNLANAQRNSVVPGAATVIIVVCVGFLALMVVLGIFRIRSIHRQETKEGSSGGKEGEIDWDDSALTIIVNPMESYELQHGVAAEGKEEKEEKGEEGEESLESLPGDAPDNQRIIIKLDG
ncbi:calsyntenin-3-like isoform X1 [Polyodon spathula]|uniref:calsyntenin-3-like isoform X1 n=1 Tax=Polyodon spathula TaxID=7913 RepID=UPI001B7E54BD|nr:calsyntenin-3-like isoform X1 [Polyodon spathula]XP_041124665.1 calsyntenin-3-like isoform X1 [Polyodon spathula]XP_041124666.1 calsyntenin-3-like isoform X1 [Polyodon spathula]XP_041124667.1 calsyntenin-3-like isoform X1 [Polyodon spathula]XP_041124668.1 calsyntenin-3-like isoform X1 [Polyodon spathula]XP_041124669.1 calsyntenin-3-like isoform X1 [Polyodon spathula]XP_041124670.1 calsyntenin-3-like isoform X1 [Polyodon spathula]XP_041124671.1 calsyntenin-3-like isoform X1 [Polyodon spath